MALYKEIKQPDGIITKYHRILYIQSTINSCTSIVVISYVDEDNRREQTIENTPYNVIVTYERLYHENMTIEEAYDYLKSLPVFKGATDV